MKQLTEQITNKINECLNKGYYLYLYHSASYKEFWIDVIDPSSYPGKTKEDLKKIFHSDIYDNLQDLEAARRRLNYDNNYVMHLDTAKKIKRLEETAANFSLGMDFKRLDEKWDKFISEHPDSQKFFDEFFKFRETAKQFADVLSNLTNDAIGTDDFYFN